MGKKLKKIPYAGPNPESGMIFAIYNCKCGFEQISNRGAAMYCHACGDNTEEVEPLKEKIPVISSTSTLVCSVCKVKMRTTAGKHFCTLCGGELGEDEDIIDEDIEEDVDEDIEEDVDEDTDAENEEDEEEIVVEEDGDGDEDEVEEEEAMLQEILTDLPTNAKFSSSEINLDLFGSEESPFYNVTVAGNPVARIHLADQVNPEEIRAIFSKPEYAESIAKAIEKCGVHDVLNSVNASYFVNQIKKSDLADEMKASAKTELEKEYRNKVVTLRDDYADAISTVIAGINKNFYPDVENSIKAGLYNRLSLLNIKSPTNMIEEVFAETGPEFFASVLEKAQDYMSKSEEAREEIASAIKEMNHIKVADDDDEGFDIDPYEAQDSQALSHRMAKGSNVLNMIAGSLSQDNDKTAMRNKLKLHIAY